MKQFFTFLVLLLSLAPIAFSEPIHFDIGNINFFISPKILEDGAVIDTGLGYRYSQKLSGSLRFRSTLISKNEELQGVSDSLNAIHERMYELYFTPIEYDIYMTPKTRFWIGGGLYYQYSNLNEKGFFNMPVLETLEPPKERVNSYTNNFKMHLLGPLAEVGISFDSQWVHFSFFGGMNPVFALISSQEMDIEPLISNPAEYTENTWGSPYFYFGLDTVIFKYINIALLYDFARLRYKTVDFDNSFSWINPERTVLTQSLNVEASILVPVGTIGVQMGGGYTLNFIRLDNKSSVSENRPYIILAARKSGS